MHTAILVPPKQRVALLSALDSANHTLKRSAGGFMPSLQPVKRSGPQTIETITKRTVLALECNGLVTLDNEACPSRATLTDSGLKLAEQLKAEAA
ncbi:hypothetical protein [Pseudoxanthomonas sp. JBR18]|uniref:hypothetical protein n=1 Tax=Pseudoxanthomonas sp. JBR18 TaxID=2969308 RepID=UPI0023065A7F|nr:hypothetical protein [Pseudoxanthomonas sp. JBR18]WCE02817.1 hypothetical protein PJ250_11750 [Pseudoxanthomonas sp. JBR18]